MTRESLTYTLNRLSLSGGGEHSRKASLSDLTIKSYKANNSRFSEFCKSEIKVKSFKALEDYGFKQALGKYVSYLIDSGKSPHTIHTMIAPVCKACNISMADIGKPKRKAAEVKRGRYIVSRSEREENLQRYKTAVEFQRVVGCRVEDLRKLTGGALRKRSDGALYVYLPAGKGGKDQLQRVLPEHEQLVRDTFKGVGKGEKVFKAEEISKNINYHGMRADHAKYSYKYYCELVKDPVEKDKLKKWLERKYITYGNPSDYALKQFRKEINSDVPYKLRGDNLNLAIDKGYPVEYDRLALMAVSVEHLSHWRLSVTVSNYMLA